jgi:hypothetical protein
MMDVKLDFELVAKDGKLEVVVVVVFDSSEFVELVKIDDESVPCHLVDGLVVPYGVVILCYYARVGPQGNFYFRANVHSGI